MEGSFVRCRVAEVEREELLIGDLGGFLIEAGLLQAIGTVEEPAVLGHCGNQESFGGVLRRLLVHEGLEQGVVLRLVFAGQDAEGFGIVVEAVRGPVLGAGGLTEVRNRPCAVLRILAIREDLLFC